MDKENAYFEAYDYFLIDKSRSKIVAFHDEKSAKIIVSEGIVDIGFVFSDLREIDDIYIPSSVIWIMGIPQKYNEGEYDNLLIIHGKKGSYAERYDDLNGIRFEED